VSTTPVVEVERTHAHHAEAITHLTTLLSLFNCRLSTVGVLESDSSVRGNAFPRVRDEQVREGQTEQDQMVISRCCNNPVKEGRAGVLMKKALICSEYNKEVEYSDCVWVEEK
jgi:hypothetical protein